MSNSNDDDPPTQTAVQMLLSVLHIFQAAGYILAVFLQKFFPASEDGL